MLRIRKKREAQRSAFAAKRLVQVAASIAGLENEDLLDLADIFKATPDTPIMQYAVTEMGRRGISV